MEAIRIPKTIVLNLQRELAEFRKGLAEFDLNHETTAESIIEQLWIDFAFEDTRDENLWATLHEIVEQEIGYDNDKEVAYKFEGLVHFIGSALYDQMDYHNFYHKIGYLPYNLKFYPNNLIVMERDDDIIRVQNGQIERDEPDAVYVNLPSKNKEKARRKRMVEKAF